MSTPGQPTDAVPQLPDGGTVLRAGDDGWDAARQAFNLLLDQRPALIAIPASDADVAAVVRFASERGLRVAPQCTGHGAGVLGSLEGSVLLRTERLTGVEVDVERRRVRVRAGSRWADVVPATAPHGLAPLSGMAPTVGVVGYTLGGGLGWLGRRHGLAANSVLAIELVTAEGEPLRVSADDEPELFWALRGSCGQVGVVTAIELALYLAPELHAGSLFFPWERSAEVLHAWRTWTEELPDEVTSLGRIVQIPPLPVIPEPLRGRSFAVVELAHLGGEAATAELLEPLRALGPEIDTVAAMAPDGLGAIHMDPPEPGPAISGHCLLGELSPAVVDAFVEAVGPDSGSPLVSAELRHTGGALSRAADGHGVLPGLPGTGLAFAVGIAFDEAMAAAATAQLARLDAALAPHAIGRFANFTEAATDPGVLFGDALGRLRSAQERWDPQGRIHATHDVAPAT